MDNLDSKEQVFIDKLARIGGILDTRLTTATLDKVYPQIKILEEVLLSPEELTDRHKTVRINFLEYVGNWAEKQIGEPLGGEWLALVMEAVDRFLTSQGFRIKS